MSDENRIRVPKFASEREEADWWYSQREVHGELFVKAAEAGTLKRGGAAKLLAELRAKRAAKAAEAAAQPVELDPNDARKAIELAARRGVPYQTFVKELLHEALERELSAAD